MLLIPVPAIPAGTVAVPIHRPRSGTLGVVKRLQLVGVARLSGLLLANQMGVRQPLQLPNFRKGVVWRRIRRDEIFLMYFPCQVIPGTAWDSKGSCQTRCNPYLAERGTFTNGLALGLDLLVL